MAQGGINAALSHEDSSDHHIADTLRSSAGLGDEARIAFLCENAPHAIAWCNAMGMPFSRDEAGNIAQRRLGGAKVARACNVFN
jgi:succinate dehydrogenase / fumarate reductase flavoprotein subunit